MKKKTILFPIPVEVDKLNYQSGSFSSIFQELNKIYNIIPVGPLKHRKPILPTLLNKLNKFGMSPKKYATMHTWKTIADYGKQIERVSAKLDFDYVFSVSTLYTPYFNTDKPKFAFTDFSFFNALNYYGFAKNLHPKSQYQALEVDKFCFNNHTKVFLASDWSRKSTIEAYDLDFDKIDAVGRGANLESGFSLQDLNRTIKVRQNSKKKIFLFVGVNWSRKGGEIAFQIVQDLIYKGHDIELNVVGCTPPVQVTSSSFVKVYPFLDRSKKEDLSTLRMLFERAWIFILPTTAEAMGIVFAEAASFGLPSISYNTGGVSTAIEDNATGILQILGDGHKKFIPRLLDILNNDDQYYKFSYNAFAKYKAQLNWSTIIKNIAYEIDKY